MAITTIPIEDLNRDSNVRRDLGDLGDLTLSIKQVGVLQPVTITPNILAGHDLVAGHRRVAASLEAGLAEVPCHVVEFDSEDARLVATLVENLVREDLDPLDEAGGLQRLIEAGWSRDKISRKVSRSKAHISKRLSLLSLPSDVQEKVRTGDYTVEHGYQVSRLVSDGFTDKQVTKLATQSTSNVETELKRKKLDRQMELRAEELKAKGSRVKVTVPWRHKEIFELNGWKMKTIDAVAHAFEPCHLILIQEGYDPNHPILEVQCCDDTERHLPDGESKLKLDLDSSDYLGGQRSEEIRKAQEKAEKRRAEFLTELAADIDKLPTEELIETVLRIAAAAHLDPDSIDLVPYDKQKYGAGAYGWFYPAEAIAEARTLDLATALARHFVNYMVTLSWWADQNPETAVFVRGLAETIGIEFAEADAEESEKETDDE